MAWTDGGNIRPTSRFGVPMQNPRTALAYLAKAESRILETRDRIAWHAAFVRRLRAVGEDGQHATVRLGQLRQDLETWQDHRDELVGRLADSDQDSRGYR